MKSISVPNGFEKSASIKKSARRSTKLDVSSPNINISQADFILVYMQKEKSDDNTDNNENDQRHDEERKSYESYLEQVHGLKIERVVREHEIYDYSVYVFTFCNRIQLPAKRNTMLKFIFRMKFVYQLLKWYE